jgi:hypothetical protein
MTDTVLIFMKLTQALQCFVKNFYIKFNVNPTNSTVTDTGSWKDMVSHTHTKFFFLLLHEC